MRTDTAGAIEWVSGNHIPSRPDLWHGGSCPLCLAGPVLSDAARVSRGRYLSEGRPMSGKDFGPAQAPVRTALGDDGERRRGAPSAQVSDALDEVLAVRAAQVGRAALEVVDVGAGTGGFAVRLAKLGHHVTVVDPSPDALAAARWRAAELGVTLTAVQGEASELAALVGEGAADLVVCHNVLEYVDSPAAAMTAIARVLRPGGTVSVLAANVVAAVLQRALAGRYDEARRLLTSNEGDPVAPVPPPAPAAPAPAPAPIPAS